MDDESMIDDFLDCTGRVRRFRVGPFPSPGGLFMEAIELKDGVATGLRFMVPFREDEVPPWGEIRRKIRAFLSQRDVVRGPDGDLTILNDRIRGQLTDGEAGEDDCPDVLVDDMVLSWADVGRLLRPYAGFKIRIEVGED